jgi:hypothetical protein
VSASQGDSRGIRTWGRLDRLRRERHALGRDDVYERMAKDLRAAVVAGSAESVVLPLTSVAAALLPTSSAQRDRELEERTPVDAIPRCEVCGQELAAPFRGRGVHPECAR